MNDLKLSKDQIEAVNQIVLISESLADIVYNIMHRNRLDEIDGCMLEVYVNPECRPAVRSVRFGRSTEDPCGRVSVYKREGERDYETFGTNTTEYECLLASPPRRERLKAVLQGKKEIPPDGLWLSVYDDHPPLDDRG